MKRIEEILKSKLGGTKAEANPSMDDALWNKVESGLNGSLPAGGTAGHAIGRTWAVFGGVTLFAAGVGVGLMWDEKQFHDPVTQSIEATDVEEHVRAQSSSEAREPQSAATFSEAEGSSNSSNEVEPTLADASHKHAPLMSSALNTRNNDRTETVEREPAGQTAMPAKPSADAGAPFHTQITEAPRSGEGQPVLEPQSPFIPPLALNPIGISGDHNSAEPFLQHMNRDMPAHARHFAIRAFGGLTLSQFQYRTEDLRAFSNRFHTASSGGGGFAFDFDYKDQDWSVGLGWLDFAQRLEFEHTWQTEFTDPNGIVSVEIDQISGDTIAMETGPLLVTATHHRHVRDFNHISAIVIPMEWRKQVLFSRWTLGTGVGAPEFFTLKVPVFFNEGKFISLSEKNILNGIVGVLILSGSLMLAFSKEKLEDEFIEKIRLESLVWSVYVNVVLILFSFIFFYDWVFFWVMIINLFTVLWFFTIRFNWKIKRLKKTFKYDE